MKRIFFIALTCLSPLTACTVFEEYTRPDFPTHSTWNSQVENTQLKKQKSHEVWWRKLGDKPLAQLLEKTLNNNLDLKIAEARIVESRALRGEVLSRLLPSVDATASVSSRGSQSSLGNSDKTNHEWQAGANVNWAVDLFGGGRADLSAAEAATGKTEAEYRQTTISLISETARTYVEMRALQQRMALTRKNLKLEEETLRVTSLQEKAEAVSKLDVLRASAQVETTRAELPLIETLLAASYNRLSIISGEAPGSLDSTITTIKPVPEFNEKIILNLPLDVITNRPDVQAAEYALIQATDIKNSASAEIFPKLNLSAFLGTGGASLFAASNPWSIAASAVLPLLDFSRIESRIKMADARKMQAFHNYKRTVLKAIEEVENSIFAYSREMIRARSLEKAVTDTREAARLARIKYQAGDTSFLDLLIAEERLLNAESSAVISHANVSKTAISLYSALGEGDREISTDKE